MAGTPRKKERYEVLFEEASSKMERVAEGHSTLVRWCERLEARFAEVEMRIGWLERAVTRGLGEVREAQKQTNQHLDQLVTRFDAHERAHAN